MPGASSSTVRVRVVNANWTAGEHRTDGAFELMLVTENDERHTITPTVDAMSALLAMIKASPVLLWDPENRTLIGANIVGEWLPADWSSADRPA